MWTGLTLFLVIFTRLLIALYDFQEGTGLHNEVYSPRVLRFKHSLFAMADNKQAVALGAILHVFGLLAIVWYGGVVFYSWYHGSGSHHRTFCHAVYLRTVHPGPGLQIFGMLCAYGSDNGGLFFGKTFKGPKLAPVSCVFSLCCRCNLQLGLWCCRSLARTKPGQGLLGVCCFAVVLQSCWRTSKVSLTTMQHRSPS